VVPGPCRVRHSGLCLTPALPGAPTPARRRSPPPPPPPPPPALASEPPRTSLFSPSYGHVRHRFTASPSRFTLLPSALSDPARPPSMRQKAPETSSAEPFEESAMATTTFAKPPHSKHRQRTPGRHRRRRPAARRRLRRQPGLRPRRGGAPRRPGAGRHRAGPVVVTDGGTRQQRRAPAISLHWLRRPGDLLEQRGELPGPYRSALPPPRRHNHRDTGVRAPRRCVAARRLPRLAGQVALARPRCGPRELFAAPGPSSCPSRRSAASPPGTFGGFT